MGQLSLSGPRIYREPELNHFWLGYRAPNDTFVYRSGLHIDLAGQSGGFVIADAE